MTKNGRFHQMTWIDTQPYRRRRARGCEGPRSRRGEALSRVCSLCGPEGLTLIVIVWNIAGAAPSGRRGHAQEATETGVRFPKTPQRPRVRLYRACRAAGNPPPGPLHQLELSGHHAWHSRARRRLPRSSAARERAQKRPCRPSQVTDPQARVHRSWGMIGFGGGGFAGVR